MGECCDLNSAERNKLLPPPPPPPVTTQRLGTCPKIAPAMFYFSFFLSDYLRLGLGFVFLAKDQVKATVSSQCRVQGLCL